MMLIACTLYNVQLTTVWFIQDHPLRLSVTVAKHFKCLSNLTCGQTQHRSNRNVLTDFCPPNTATQPHNKASAVGIAFIWQT